MREAGRLWMLWPNGRGAARCCNESAGSHRNCGASRMRAAHCSRACEPAGPPEPGDLEMTVARITEISSISKKSFEDAIVQGVTRRQQDAQERQGRMGEGSGSADRERQDGRLQGDPEGRRSSWRSELPHSRGSGGRCTIRRALGSLAAIRPRGALPPPAGPRDTTSAPARRRPHGESPSPAPRARTSRTFPGARNAVTGRWSRDGCRYWPIVSMSMSCARMSRMTARISSSVSPRPTIRPDFVGTPGTRALELAQQRQRMRVVRARAAPAGTAAGRSRGCGS